MHGIISVAFVLWLGYGAVIESWPMVVFNLANLPLGGATLAREVQGTSPRKQRPLIVLEQLGFGVHCPVEPVRSAEALAPS
ncbi:hypothetical protein JNW90_32235 [Micromonospora sp. STR1s_5]|nr:hypothetical protein [Micromonospora sp. STR1s_5]MBM0207147.1 hypothetical protein [Micromonospora sp. STR1s_5]